MSFKSRSIGLFAAAALSLSIVGGVAAQSNDSVTRDASVELQDKVGGTCYVAIADTQTDLNLGTATWDGSAYVFDDGKAISTGRFNVTVTQDKSSQPWRCNISASSDGLSQLDDSGEVVPDGVMLSADLTVNSKAVNTDDISVPTGDGLSGVPVSVTVDPETYAPAVYKGTITVSVQNSSN